MPFKLIATDLDGTLFGPDLQLGARVTAAFARARAAGAKVVIATGRMFRSALPYARDLGVTEPLITYQGAWVRHPVSLETLWHRTLPGADTLAALAYLRAAGIHVNLYREDTLYVERETPECRWYCQQARIEPVVAPDLASLHSGVTKLVAIAAPETLDRIQPEVEAALGARLYVIRSTPRYLEFAAQGTSKAVALGAMAAGASIRAEEILAFGDADNDADMLSMAGLGVAVGEASERARASAQRHVAPAGAGVAEVLEELF
ncbi:MAG: Cof-type HAD-IIB family hydrolase [Candidatus Sericytochromatia bacterium]|nr:Cof-type HAD-IIB family hydrolase [Candidatus Tanganyikabacteria bacterium]